MKILGGMLPDYWGGYIPPWICTHGYERFKIIEKLYLSRVSRDYFGLVQVNLIHKYETRCSANFNFKQIYARTELAKKTITFTGPKIWRAVPRDIKCYDITKFKSEYKKFLINQYCN